MQIPSRLRLSFSIHRSHLTSRSVDRLAEDFEVDTTTVESGSLLTSRWLFLQARAKTPRSSSALQYAACLPLQVAVSVHRNSANV